MNGITSVSPLGSQSRSDMLLPDYQPPMLQNQRIASDFSIHERDGLDERIARLQDDDLTLNKRLHQDSFEQLGLNKSSLDPMLPFINKRVPDYFDGARNPNITVPSPQHPIESSLQHAKEKVRVLPDVAAKFEAVVITQGFCTERRKAKATMRWE